MKGSSIKNFLKSKDQPEDEEEDVLEEGEEDTEESAIDKLASLLNVKDKSAFEDALKAVITDCME